MPRIGSTVLALTALVVSATAGLAQGMTFGLKGGGTSSTMKFGDDTLGISQFLDRRTSVAGGAFIRLGSGSLGLQLEAMYVSHGVAFSATEPTSGQSLSGSVRLAYAEFPALLRLGMKSGSLQPYLYGGPSFMLEVLCEAQISIAGTDTTASCDSDDASQQTGGAERRSGFLGAVAGAGIEYGLGSMSLLLELRYSMGLQSLDASDEADVKPESISVLAGFSMPLGRKKGAR